MTAVAVHQHRLAQVRKATAAHVQHLWDQLPDYDKARAEPFARAAAPVVAAGQLVTARATTAYLTRRLHIPPPRIQAHHVTGLRSGADPVDVYQRPFGIVWKALGDGKPLDQAIAMGRTRAGVLVATDVLLAMKTATTIIGGRDSRIVGWTRVADSGACDLCSADDGAFYENGDDMGIHPGCGCTLDPAFDDNGLAADPGATATHEHDELGPLIYEAGQSFAKV